MLTPLVNSHPGHKGRPGKRGGSLPANKGIGKFQVTDEKLFENPEYLTGILSVKTLEHVSAKTKKSAYDKHSHDDLMRKAFGYEHSTGREERGNAVYDGMKEGYARLFYAEKVLYVELSSQYLAKAKSWIKATVDPRKVRSVEFEVYGGMIYDKHSGMHVPSQRTVVEALTVNSFFGHKGRPGKRGGSLPGKSKGPALAEIKSAIEQYTKAPESGGGQYTSHQVNKYLRAKYPTIRQDAPFTVSTGVEYQVQLIDWAFKTIAHALDKPTSVFRGINHPETTKELSKLKVGDTFSDAAYLSTSLNQESAEDFGGTENSTEIEIRLPIGTRYLYGHAFEQEIILHRNTVFKVVSVNKRSKYLNYLNITVEPVVSKQAINSKLLRIALTPPYDSDPNSVSLLNYDPTRLTTLRREINRDLDRRFGMIATAAKFNIVMNTFCPTGEGGGVDPSCSPKKKGLAKVRRGWIVRVTGESGKWSVLRVEGDQVTVADKGGKKRVVKVSTLYETDTSDRVKKALSTIKQGWQDYNLSKSEEWGRMVKDTHKALDKEFPGAVKLTDVQKVIEAAADEKTISVAGEKFTIRTGLDIRDYYVKLIESRTIDRKAANSESLHTTISSQTQKSLLADNWWNGPVTQAYSQGINHAHRDARVKAPDDFVRFTTNASWKTVAALSKRLHGLIEDFSVNMSRKVASLLINGDKNGFSVDEITDHMMDLVELERWEAKRIAQTELTRIHSESQLDTFNALGIQQVRVKVETRHDGKVCEKCKYLRTMTFNLKQARGLLPRHPNCRCAFKAIKNKKSSFKDTSAIYRAIRRTLNAFPGHKGRPGKVGGSLPKNRLSSQEQTKVSEWREHLWHRGFMTHLAQKTVKGGSLAHFHPGEITVYRGRPLGSKSKSSAKGLSYTKSREVAEMVAEGGKVEELQLTRDIPAIDVNKALYGIPSKSEHEQEVFVVR